MKNYIVHIALILFAGLAACKGPGEVTSTKEPSTDKRSEVTFVFIEANKQKMLGNLEAAMDGFRQVLKMDPDNHPSMYELAGILDYAGEGNAAIALTEEAVKLAPENLWYRRQLANLYGNHGRFADAAGQFRIIADKEPQNVENYLEWANVLVFDRKFQDAVDVLDKVEKQTGKDFQLTVEKYNLYLKMQKETEALNELEQFVKENPEHVQALGYLAEAYVAKGEDAKAMALYEKVLKLEPDNPVVHLSLYEFYDKKGETEKAKQALLTAFNNPDLDIDIKMQILLDLYEKSEKNPAHTPLAYDLIEKFIRLHPDDPKPYAIKGDFLLRDDKQQEARDAFMTSKEKDPNRFAIWNQIMLLNARLQEADQQIETTKEAMELFPSQPIIYLYSGLAKKVKKDYDGAIEDLEGGVMMVVDNPQLRAEFYSNLGDTYNELKEYKSSDEAYDMALSINPDNAFVLNNYSYYLSLRKVKLDLAASMAKKANQLEPNTASFEDTYGWILYQQGKYNDAATWIKKSLDHGGDKDGVVLEHYGDTQFQLGNKTAAMEYWKQAKAAGGATDLIDKKIADGKLYE